MSNQVDALNVKINLDVTGQSNLNSADAGIKSISTSTDALYKSLNSIKNINLTNVLRPLLSSSGEITKLSTSIKLLTNVLKKETLGLGALSEFDYRVLAAGARVSFDTALTDTAMAVEKAYARVKEMNDKLQGLQFQKKVNTITLIAAAIMLVVKAVKALIDLVADTADWAKTIESSSQAVFMSVESYQKWSYIIEYTGTEMEKLRVAMRALQQEDNQEVLKKYGLFTGSNEQNFENAIKYVQSLGSELEKTTVAADIFGKASDDLASIYLTDSDAIDALINKAEKLGLIFSQDYIDSAARVSDDLNDLKLGWNALGRSVAIMFMPAIEEALHKLLQVVAALNSIFNKFHEVATDTAEATDAINASIEETKHTLAGFDELNLLNQTDTESDDDSEGSLLSVITEDDVEHIEMLSDLFDKVSEVVKQIDWSEFLAPAQVLFGYIQEVVMAVLDIFVSSGLLKNAFGLTADVASLVNEIIGPLLPYLEDVLRYVINAVSDVIGIVRAFINGDIYELEKWLGRLLEDLPRIISSVLATIGRLISTLLVKVYNDMIAWFKNKTLGEVITQFLKIIANSFIDQVNALLNAFVNPLVGFIGGVFGQDWNISNIPRLANGGVAYKPTIAQIGEYSGASSNPEIVAPQSIMLETMATANSEVVSALVQCTRQLLTGMEDNRTVVSIGDDQIAKSAARGNNNYKKMTGYSLI